MENAQLNAELNTELNVELNKYEQEAYNDKRFPKRWQAFLASALMRTAGGIVATVIILVLQQLIMRGVINFSSEFGADMFNAVISQICMVLPIPLIFMFVFKNDIGETLRLKKDIDALQILLIAGMCIGAFIPAQYVNGVVVMVLQSFLGEPMELSGVTSAQNIVQLLSEIVIIGFLPAICEEIFYRGYVLRGLERKGNKKYALLISSLLFAVMHGNFQQMTYAFALGILLGFVVLKTDSLLSSIVMHATFNIISVILSYGPINDFYVQYNAQIVAVALIFSPALLAGSIVLFSLYTKKRNARLGTSNALPTYESIKEKPYENVLSIVLFVAFILTNVAEAFLAW